jgi:hypothetical protein
MPELSMPEIPEMPALGEYPSWPETSADLAERKAEMNRYREESKQQAAERRTAMKQMNEQRRLWNRMRYPHRYGHDHWRGYRAMPAGFAPLQQPAAGEAPTEQSEPKKAEPDQTLPSDAPTSAQVQ